MTNKLTNLDVEFRGCGVVNKLPSTDMWTANTLDACDKITLVVNLHNDMTNFIRKLFSARYLPSLHFQSEHDFIFPFLARALGLS